MRVTVIYKLFEPKRLTAKRVTPACGPTPSPITDHQSVQRWRLVDPGALAPLAPARHEGPLHALDPHPVPGPC